jgi:carbonic anhydrase/acetyltransferase-like protein (isoleucine patch superfamily)
MVRLSSHASVWFGAVLRGDNDWITVGERSNIQDGCVLHVDHGQPLDIGNDCTIGHHAILHSCTIGDGSLVGMGATVLNRAVIGKGSLVGANALVTEGKVFPDYSLIVGSPARAIRTLDEAAVSKLLASASHYVENWQRYKTSLLPVA